jgi:carboxyl-terminal processing protease
VSELELIMRTGAALTLLVAALVSHAATPRTPREILGAILTHAESASMYRDRVDWPATRREVFRLADTARTVGELAPAFRFLLQALGDEHARVLHAGRPIAWHYGPPKAHQSGFDTRIYSAIQTGREFPFRTTLLAGNVGYVRVVGLPMGDNTAMAKQIDDAVCDVHRRGATRWIVDLRYNGGGNLNPMAEGIASIIGDGPVGGWTGLTPAENGAWQNLDGDFDNGGYSIRLPNSCTVRSGSAVAVLTSVYTASSGEALAVMFKGRPNTRTFGSKTLGMITVTDWTQVDSATAVTISVGRYRDRTGRIYDTYVEPDDAVPFVPTEALDADAGVQHAARWLLRAPTR